MGIKNLTKRYGKKIALDNISFSVKPGEILGFLGSNGAGKSTTMNIITGYLSADEWSVSIDNDEIFENPVAVKSKIGYLPEILPLNPEKTVKGYLEFIFDLKKAKLKNLDKHTHVEEVCSKVNISNVS